ncbi:MAG: SpoIIE family protein phosphatase, partial [Clostridia bacterium]|nr:SpoIIE family protein phosphatase [Clostridia bacterium]
ITISKIGAAPTYIIKDGLVKKLECSSLPAGILTDIQAQNYIIDADDKTVVVMMSDGISNTTLKNVYEQDWISGELQSIAAYKPDAMARHIMNSAIKRYGGKCADDMTVAVAIIYRNE